ncbi:MAG: hypothetical protein ACODAD_03770, partial [Planctomycetota bacterium]
GQNSRGKTAGARYGRGASEDHKRGKPISPVVVVGPETRVRQGESVNWPVVNWPVTGRANRI